jgi:hypothetical protein
MSTSELAYIAHLYDHNLVFKSTLGGASILNKPGLKLTQNGGYQQITIEVATPVTGIVLGDVIRLTEQGDNAGTILFSGNVETTPEENGPAGAHHLITVTPWVAELGDGFFNKTYSTNTDVAQFVRDAVAATAHCSVSPISCPDTGVVAQYDFQNTNPLDAIHVARQIAGPSYFYFVDAQGVVWFQPVVTTIPGTLTAILKVQAGVLATSGPGTTTITPTLPGASTAGNCLIAIIAGNSTSAGPAGWSRIGGFSSSFTQIWACPNAASVSSAAFTTSGANQAHAFMSEWSGVVPSAILDSSGVATDFSGVATTLDPTTGSSITVPGDLVITCFSALGSGTVTFTTPSTFTRLQDSGATSDSIHLDSEFRVNPPVGSPIGPTLTVSAPGNLNGAIVALKAVSTAPTPQPPTLTLRRGVQYNEKKGGSSIGGMRNKIPVIGGSIPSSGDPTRITSLYDGLATQALYGVRAFNPTPAYPNVSDQATLDKIAASLGQQYDRAIATYEVNTPALGLRLTPGRPGGLTVRLWEPTTEPLVESGEGLAAGYSPIYIVQDVEINGPSQRLTIGDIPFADLDTTYEATRIAQRTSVIAAVAVPSPALVPQVAPVSTIVYGLCRSVTGSQAQGGGIVTVATATFTTPKAGTCQVIGAIDLSAIFWDNYVATPRRAVRATLSSGVFTGAWQELPISGGIGSRVTLDLSSASGLALAAGTYTVSIQIDTQELNQIRIFSGYVQVAVTA